MPARKNYNKNYRRRNGSHKKDSGTFQLPLKVSFLGGLNEIGKNMTLFEYDGDMTGSKVSSSPTVTRTTSAASRTS